MVLDDSIIIQKLIVQVKWEPDMGDLTLVFQAVVIASILKLVVGVQLSCCNPYLKTNTYPVF